MKKLLLFGFLWFTYSAASAQHIRVTDDGLDLVVLSIDLDGPAMANLEMKQELDLTDEQYAQVELLNNSRYEQLQHAEASYAHDSMLRSKEVKDIHQRNDLSLRQVLSENQLKAYQQLEGRYLSQFISENEGE